MKTYKGKYKVKQPKKYIGDATAVTYRSHWEKSVMLWCDRNPDVVKWASEEIVVPYVCDTDGKPHRYFVDFYIELNNGEKYLVEVKPSKETKKPVRKGKKKSRYLTESLTYIKNQCKWTSAASFAKANGMIFVVWTEHELKAYGIKKF